MSDDQAAREAGVDPPVVFDAALRLLGIVAVLPGPAADGLVVVPGDVVGVDALEVTLDGTGSVAGYAFGAISPCSGQLVASTVTGPDGESLFDGLCASRCTICVDESNLSPGFTQARSTPGTLFGDVFEDLAESGCPLN